MAELDILNTPSGRILSNLINDGISVNFRLMGVGNGTVLIQIVAYCEPELPGLPRPIKKYRSIDDPWLMG